MTFKRHLTTTSSLFIEAYCVPNYVITVLTFSQTIISVIFAVGAYCIFLSFILFNDAVQYCKRRYTNSFCDCD